ncbi:MAG: polyprenyl synthetase family protein [Simkaniaceae bacterium]
MSNLLFLNKRKKEFEARLQKSLCGFGEETSLKKACSYALLSEGKRFRPLIVLLVAEALGADAPWDAALSVEYFHTASLIADDLPCMDDDDERRGKKSLHQEFGEPIALLSSYALITKAFEKIHDASKSLKGGQDQIALIALKTASELAGIKGATKGQFFDIFPPEANLDRIKEVLYLKTVTLFEVSFIFGWLFGSGDIKKIEEVKRLAYHFGMAFQISDDIRDFSEDSKKGEGMNMAIHLGVEKAKDCFFEELELAKKQLEKLQLNSEALLKIFSLLQKRLERVHPKGLISHDFSA